MALNDEEEAELRDQLRYATERAVEEGARALRMKFALSNLYGSVGDALDRDETLTERSIALLLDEPPSAAQGREAIYEDVLRFLYAHLTARAALAEREPLWRTEQALAIIREALSGRCLVLPFGARGREAVAKILGRIASWTPARFDQHLRFEVGDEEADLVLDWLGRLGLYRKST